MNPFEDLSQRLLKLKVDGSKDCKLLAKVNAWLADIVEYDELDHDFREILNTRKYGKL